MTDTPERPGPAGSGRVPDSAAPDSVEPDSAEAPASGLRNPAGAIRALGIMTLVLEWIVVLLAVQPIRILAPDRPGWALGVVVGLAFACLGVATLLRFRWGWHVGTALQVAVALAGFVHWAMLPVAAIFLSTWLYVLHVRRTITGGPAPSEPG